MDVIAALERSFDRTGKTVAGIGSAELVQPTSLPGWDVAQLLDHVLALTWVFTKASQGDALPEGLHEGFVGDDPAASYADAVRASLDAWRRPGALTATCDTPLGPLPGEFAVMLMCMEVSVHGTDLGQAVGGDTDIDPDVAELLLPFVEQLPLDDIRAEGEIGPAVTLPADASTSRKVLALLGR